MKKMLVAAILPALASANVSTAKADNCGWAMAGALLTGAAAGVVIANALNCQPTGCPVTNPRCAPCPAPVPQRVVSAPAPVVYVPAPIVVRPRPVFITLRPLAIVGYGYDHGPDARGRGHGHRC